MTIFDSIMATRLTDLDLTRYVEVAPDMTVADTVGRMADAEQSCALVVRDGRLAGVFTQRDVLNRVIGRPADWELPVGSLMNQTSWTLDGNRTVEDGLALMNQWWVRSIPVVDAEGGLEGNLSYYTIMRLMAKGIADRTSTGEPQLRHGLELVDFPGLNTATPVSVSADDTVDVPLHHMRARAIGSVLVTDERDNLVGIVTEWDFLEKVGCSDVDLGTLMTGEIMSTDPVALAARSPIADAIQQMAERAYSHIPLLGESGRPVGVASFRDVAAYFEASLPALT